MGKHPYLIGCVCTRCTKEKDRRDAERASAPVKPARVRSTRASRRYDALHAHARRVYETDRDYDCEEFSNE